MYPLQPDIDVSYSISELLCGHSCVLSVCASWSLHLTFATTPRGRGTYVKHFMFPLPASCRQVSSFSAFDGRQEEAG